MMGSQSGERELFSYAINLEKRVRSDHPLRRVAALIDFKFVREEVGHCYGSKGNVAGSPSFSGNTMTVSLTGVTDVQKITVTLSNVTDSFAQVLPNTAVSMNLLIGDVNGNKSVNGTDVSQTKIQSGAAVTAANFREDVNISGAVSGTDVSIIKLRSGAGLP